MGTDVVEGVVFRIGNGVGVHNETQFPLLPWSSQQRVLRGRFAPENREKPGYWCACYYNDSNFERLNRAQILGEKKGVQPDNRFHLRLFCINLFQRSRSLVP